MIAGGDVTPLRHEDPPILVCADLQIEYLAEAADAVTSRCGVLLSLWRENLWPVLHLKRIAQAAWFNPASNLTDWIEQFRPRPGEMVFEHPLPSAYSSTRFAEYMSSMKNIRCAVVGFSLDETILSTAIEGFHRGHQAGKSIACFSGNKNNVFFVDAQRHRRPGKPLSGVHPLET